MRGDQRRNIDLLRALARHAEVRLLAVPFGEHQPLPFEGVETVSVAMTPLGRLRANLRAPDPRLPGQVRLYLDAAFQAALRAQLETFRPDVVHVSVARLAPYLPPPGPWHRHLDLIDALSLNMARRAAGERGPAKAAFAAEARLLARYEARAARAADSASLVSEADRAAAPGLEGCAVVPNGVDPEALPYADPTRRPPALVFFGNLGYFPNLEPARVVAEEVLPLVRHEVPDAALSLVGARPAAAVTRLAEREGVTVVGPVERMADALHAAAVAVVPMYAGSGMNNKVVEAMSAGTAVVANATAMRGIPGNRPGVDHLRGETPAELAAAAVSLLRDPLKREALAREGRALVEAGFSWDARAAELLELYRL